MPGTDDGDGVDVERTTPSSFVVLRSRDVVAFLDIAPMVGGKSGLYRVSGAGIIIRMQRRKSGKAVEIEEMSLSIVDSWTVKRRRRCGS